MSYKLKLNSEDKDWKRIYKLLYNIFIQKAIYNNEIVLSSLRTAILRDKEVKKKGMTALTPNSTASVSLSIFFFKKKNLHRNLCY